MNKKNFLDKSGVSYLWQRIKNLLFERELEYPKPVDNQLIYSEDNKFINNFLMRNDDILVVDNEIDFKICTQISDIETDVLGAWQQFTDSMNPYKKYISGIGTQEIAPHSPEYGSGSYLNVHNNESTGGELTPGYGYWYTEKDTDGKIKILNKINSGDFNGYIMPLYKSNYSFDSVFGTNDGNTSGDEIGFSIVNDKNAFPNSIKTSSGRTYYRNTLYDIYEYDETTGKEITTAPRVPLKSAWVCEDLQQDKAYVFYTDSPTAEGENEALIISGFNTNTEFNIYELNDIKLSKGRKPFKINSTIIVTKDDNVEPQIFSKEKFVEKSESYGEIYMVSFAVTNSTSFYAKRLNKTLDSPGGGVTLYVWGTVFYKNKGSNDGWSVEYRKIIDGGSGNLGQKIIPWIANCDSSSKPCIIRSLVNFENGKLFVKFSDPSSVEYNESQELIDFNNNELCIDFTKNIYYVNSREEENGEVKITEIHPITELPDFTHNEVSVWNKFTGETKFMYDAFSYANLYIKCHNIAIDNTVLHVDKTSAKYGVWGLNEERNDYVKLIDIDNSQIEPCEYLAGSRMSYNYLTKKLFYSDGEKIYQVAEGIIDRDSLKGDPGEPGATGVGLEYNWDGTQLGVKREGDADFEYTDLIGPEGPEGPQGDQGYPGDDGIGIGYLGCSWNQHEMIIKRMYLDENGDLQTTSSDDEEIPDNCIKVLDKFPGLSAEYFSPWLDNIYNWLNHTSNTWVCGKYINYLKETEPDIYSDLYGYIGDIAYTYVMLFVQSNINNGLLALILPITPWGDYPTIKSFNGSQLAFGGNIHSYRGGNSILFYEDGITTDTDNKADIPTGFSVRVGDLVIDENFNLYKCIEE